MLVYQKGILHIILYSSPYFCFRHFSGELGLPLPTLNGTNWWYLRPKTTQTLQFQETWWWISPLVAGALITHMCLLGMNKNTRPVFVWRCLKFPSTVSEKIPSVKLTQPLKIALPQRKGLFPNHHFSEAMSVLWRVTPPVPSLTSDE